MKTCRLKSEYRSPKTEGGSRTEHRIAKRPRRHAFGPPVLGFLSDFGFRTSGLLSLLLLSAVWPLQATLSEPDNLIYGSIVIGTNAVTAANTDVIIEARRTTNGPAIASYRMGDDPALGNFYSLTLKFESVGSVADANASEVGQQVYVVLQDSGGVVGQASFTFPERGHVERVNFGAPLDDVDGNGLPDLWELTYLGMASQDPNAVGLNGLTLMDNYVAGTDPANPEDVFRVDINRPGEAVEVSFVARRAEGPGYVGKTRLYTLESRSVLGVGSWTPVPAVEALVGNNQIVAYEPAATDPLRLYRGKIELVAVQIPGAPALSIEQAGGGGVRLRWPSESVGFVLQESPDLSGTNWTDVLTAPLDNGTNWAVDVGSPVGSRFYRLRN